MHFLPGGLRTLKMLITYFPLKANCKISNDSSNKNISLMFHKEGQLPVPKQFLKASARDLQNIPTQ